jgi:hypothetical protein
MHVIIIPIGLPLMLFFRFPHHQHLYNTPFLPAAAALLGCLTLKMKTGGPSKCWKLHTVAQQNVSAEMNLCKASFYRDVN